MSKSISTKKNNLKQFLKTKKYTKYKFQGLSGCNIYISNNKKYILKTNVPNHEIQGNELLRSKISDKYKPYFLLDYTILKVDEATCLKMKYYNSYKSYKNPTLSL